ncbi:MAG: DUF309 domain-containing protein [Desulfuromonadales bacterium]
MDKTTFDPIRSCHDAAPQGLLRGVMQFNRGEYFPCHETLEELWMAEKGPIRNLYQGVLQIAVALHHWRRDKYRGAVALLASGLEKLALLPDVCLQVEIDALRDDGTRLLRRIEELGPQQMGRLEQEYIPKIGLKPGPVARQDR